MSRTFRAIHPLRRQPTQPELTWAGLGDETPFMVDRPRHASMNGFDGANRGGRHPNTSNRVKRSGGKTRRRARIVQNPIEEIA